MTQPLHYTPVVDLARMLRAMEISPLELTDHFLDRIERLNPQLNGYLTVAGEQAREAARAAGERLGTAAQADDLPPFLGVPIAIKDLTDTAGIRTTKGSAAFKDRIPTADASVVTSLRAAGFHVIGKTNTPEYGIGPTAPIGYGACRNPWDPARTTGGSSGGAGCVVAAGMAPIAHGTDGGGSIRIPASLCGVVGLKPARGRVSHAPEPQHFLAQDGTLSRTVADAAAMLDTMHGPRPGDAWWAAPPARPFAAEVGADPGTLRIGVVIDVPGLDVPSAQRKAVEAVAAGLAAAGHELVEAEIEWPGDELTGRFMAMWASRLAALEPEFPPFETLDPIIQALLIEGRKVLASEYLQSDFDMQRLSRRVVEAFAAFDLLLTPTLAGQAPLIEDLGTPGKHLMTGPFNFLWNLTGQPAISLPTHFAPAEGGVAGLGLPVGVQLVGGPADEVTLLRAAAQVEAAHPWHDRHPTLPSIGIEQEESL